MSCCSCSRSGVAIAVLAGLATLTLAGVQVLVLGVTATLVLIIVAWLGTQHPLYTSQKPGPPARFRPR